MFGVIDTANDTPTLDTPLTVTTTEPDVAPDGTDVTIMVGLQVMAVAVVPLNVTVLVPCVDPKFVPVIVTDAPTTPVVGERLLTFGVGSTVKDTPELATPLTVTTTLPVVALLGTETAILVPLQLVGVVVVPLNVTVLVPCVDPKFVPVIITDVPTAPELTERLVMLGVGNTVNDTPALATPLTVTTTEPVVAPDGTATAMLVPFQLVGVAVAPLNVTVLVACVDPKFVPVIVTDVPAVPEVGERVVMLGVGNTVNDTPTLATPLTVTTTFPVVAPLGTGTAMLVPPQLVGVAAVPLNVTVLVPCVDPKFVPVIVTDAPIALDVGERLEMLGVGNTVNDTPELATPLTVTSTLPVVAPLGTATAMLVPLQLVGVAAVPLNITVLVPCVEPKFVPVIVTDVPTAPELTERLVMLGVGNTVNDVPALATPLTVTTTFPVVAPDGTGTAMLVPLQLVGVAVVPLNVTVLVPCGEPKLVPVIVTAVPTAPEDTERLVMVGVGNTVNDVPALAIPLTVTTTLPVVAPLGTGTAMLVPLQLVGVAAVPLNITVLVP
jgi:hypothetical protein